VGAVLVLLLANLGVELWARDRRADALAEQLAGVYSLTFGEGGGSDPFSAMETRVRETRDLANHLGVTGNGLSALEVLREISARIPPDLEVALTELNIERRTIQARGHALDFESVDRIRSDLSQYEEFADVRLTDVVTDPRRGGKSFNLTIRFLEDS
jgi:type II secretory pathway component PulL